MNAIPRLVLPLWGAVALATVDGAHAAGAEEPSRTVRFAAQDFETDAGIRALYRRIAYAAEIVCNERGHRFVQARKVQARCVDATIVHALDRIGDYRLTAHHLRRAGGTALQSAAHR